MNRKFTVPIMGVITIISIVALVVVLTLNPSKSSGDDDIVATVNGDHITKNDLFQELYEQPYLENQLIGDALLDKLVNDKILNDKLDELNIVVEDHEIEARIDEHFELLAESYGSMETIEFLLSQDGMSVDDFRDMMREDLVHRLRFEKVFEDDVEITEEEIQTYYEENVAQFERPARFEIAHIFVTEEAQAEDAQSRLNAGEDFSALADELTEDPMTEAGGALGWLTADEIGYNFGEEFLEAATSTPLGEPSDIVMGYEGFHILQVTDREEEGVQPIEEVSEQIETLLFNEKVGPMINEWIDKQIEEADVEVFPVEF